MVGVAGCNSDDPDEDEPSCSGVFPPTTGVNVRPSQNSLVVTVLFDESVKDALDECGWDGTEVVSFVQDSENDGSSTSEPVPKTAPRKNKKVGDKYQIRVIGEDIVSHERESGRAVVSCNEVKLNDKIPIDDSIGGSADGARDAVFNFSVAEITELESGGESMYDIPFLNAYTEQEPAVSVPEFGVSKFLDLWGDIGYNTDAFPPHSIHGDFPDRKLPAIDHLNNYQLLTAWKLTEAKKELWSELNSLMTSPDDAKASAWNDTRGVVRETMMSVTGTEFPTDATGASQSVAENYAKVAFGTTATWMGGVSTVTGMLNAQQQIDEAGDKYAESLYEVISKISFEGLATEAVELYEIGERLQAFEEQTILPALSLSSPTNTSRGEALRKFDQQLDAERQIIYDGLETLQENHESVNISSYGFSLIYPGMDTDDAFVFDATEGELKLSGTGTSDGQEPALSETVVDSSRNAATQSYNRVPAHLMGYDAEYDEGADDSKHDNYWNGVFTLKPVGRVYAQLEKSYAAFPHGEDALDHAKFLVHILDVADLLLNIINVQQTALQLGTSPYSNRIQNNETEREVGKEIEADGSYTGDWEFNTEKKAEITSRGDPIGMWVENCSTATADSTIGTVDELSVAFDWEIIAEGWWERPEFAIETESGETIWRGSVGKYSGDAEIFDIKPDEETAGRYENTWTIETDEPIRIRFALYPSDPCDAPDHDRTTFKISNVSVTS
jgi:hypothetical protein